MADTKISQMPLALTLTGAEVAPLVQSGINVQTSLTTIVNETIQAGPSTVRTSLGLGSMAVQNSNNVSITGGSVAASTLTGTVSIANGGTGQNNRNDAINALLPAQSANKFLHSDGTNVSFQQIDLNTPDVSGTLPVLNGGTGATTLTGYVKGNGTLAFTASATIPSTDITGLGTMAVQNANNVAITGGTASNLAITGGSIDNTPIGVTTPSRVNTSLLRTTALTGFLYGNGASADVTNVPTIGATQGGTGLTSYTTGDIIYASATNTLAKLAGNTSTVNKFLKQQGNGTVAFAPDWDVIDPSDINTQYGAFQNNATLTNTTPGTGIPMQFNTTDLSNGVTIGTDLAGNKTDITIAITGVYNFAFSAQLNKSGGGGAAIDIYIWMRKNGTDIPDTNTRITLQGANLYTVAAWNFFFPASAGDKFQLMWGSSSLDAEIVYLGTPAIGPEIPAVILTVNQVS